MTEEAVPGRAVADRTVPGAQPPDIHAVLLAVAGEIDDDLLATAHELTAVGEQREAVELLVAGLVADRTALPAAVRTAVAELAGSRQIAIDAATGLAPAGLEPAAHHFAAEPDRPGGVLDPARVPQLAELLEVLRVDAVPAGSQLRLTWRLTPAGVAPGPVPHPVVLVELADGRTAPEIITYRLGALLARHGIRASVEAYVGGETLPPYHLAALRNAVPIGGRVAADRHAPPLAELERPETAEQVAGPTRLPGFARQDVSAFPTPPKGLEPVSGDGRDPDDPVRDAGAKADTGSDEVASEFAPDGGADVARDRTDHGAEPRGDTNAEHGAEAQGDTKIEHDTDPEGDAAVEHDADPGDAATIPLRMLEFRSLPTERRGTGYPLSEPLSRPDARPGSAAPGGEDSASPFFTDEPGGVAGSSASTDTDAKADPPSLASTPDPLTGPLSEPLLAPLLDPTGGTWSLPAVPRPQAGGMTALAPEDPASDHPGVSTPTASAAPREEPVAFPPARGEPTELAVDTIALGDDTASPAPEPHEPEAPKPAEPEPEAPDPGPAETAPERAGPDSEAPRGAGRHIGRPSGAWHPDPSWTADWVSGAWAMPTAEHSRRPAETGTERVVTPTWVAPAAAPAPDAANAPATADDPGSPDGVDPAKPPAVAPSAPEPPPYGRRAAREGVPTFRPPPSAGSTGGRRARHRSVKDDGERTTMPPPRPVPRLGHRLGGPQAEPHEISAPHAEPAEEHPEARSATLDDEPELRAFREQLATPWTRRSIPPRTNGHRPRP